MEKYTSYACTPERKIWSPDQVVSLEGIKVGAVYLERHQTEPVGYLVCSDIPYENGKYGIWGKFRVVEPFSAELKEKERSLIDLNIVPSLGNKGPVWNPSNWLERIGAYDEIRNTNEIPQELRKAALLLEFSKKKLTFPISRIKDSAETFNTEALINEILLDQINKEKDLDSLWSRVLVSRLIERLSSNAIHKP